MAGRELNYQSFDPIDVNFLVVKSRARMLMESDVQICVIKWSFIPLRAHLFRTLYRFSRKDQHAASQPTRDKKKSSDRVLIGSWLPILKTVFGIVYCLVVWWQRHLLFRSQPHSCSFETRPLALVPVQILARYLPGKRTSIQWPAPGFEPGTSCTQSGNHTTRPRGLVLSCWESQSFAI